MSVQLILYPQSYQGQWSSYFYAINPNQEFLVNGANFYNLSTSTLTNTTSAHPDRDAIDTSPPLIIGRWYRYTTTGSPWGAVTAPTNTNNNLVFSHNASTAGHTGVYQQLDGLIQSNKYELTVNFSAAVVGTLRLNVFTNQGLFYSSSSTSTNVSPNNILIEFTAPGSNCYISVDYTSTAGSLTIFNMGVMPSTSSPSGKYTNLEDGQVICDIYEEEDIPLTFSIDDFRDIASQVKSYSKNFDLPGTKRNNQIFENVFAVTRSTFRRDSFMFNPTLRTKFILKQDGFTIMQGYLKLIDIKSKDEQITYSVNLFSDIIALAEILEDLTFSNLNLSELDHSYNRPNIIASWTGSLVLTRPLPPDSFAGTSGSLTTGVLKYPFIDWDHNILIGQSGSGTNATGGCPEFTSLEQMFRPCIKLKYLIDRIFSGVGFTYTSDFFATADFNKLYMDFNWGSEHSAHETSTGTYSNTAGGSLPAIDKNNSSSPAQWVVLELDGTSNFHSDLGYNDTDHCFENNLGYTINYSVSFTFYVQELAGSNVNDQLVFRWKKSSSIGTAKTDLITTGEEVRCTTVKTATGTTGDIHYCTGSFTIPVQDGWVLAPLAQAKTNTSAFCQLGSSSFSANVTAVTGALLATNSSVLHTLRGETGQWDFIKSIMTMFNLVSLEDPTDPNNIIIEPYDTVFPMEGAGTSLEDRNIEYDWTNKVDVSEMELKPLNDLPETVFFKFQEDSEDYWANIYKDATGKQYGSAFFKPYGNGQSLLEGEENVEVAAFSSTVVKPLFPQYPEFVVPAIYAVNEDGECSTFDNTPRFFYDNGVKNANTDYYIPAQNGYSSENLQIFLQFSHLTTIPSIGSGVTDFHFDSDMLFNGVGAAPSDNLFNTYWRTYYEQLYNPDTRTMTIKVNLTPKDISTFDFRKMVFIKNRAFRVNKIDYKPNTLAKVEFILIG